MERLTQSGMRDALDDLVLRQRVPVLGVCVGMQMLGARQRRGHAARARLDRRPVSSGSSRARGRRAARSAHGMERRPSGRADAGSSTSSSAGARFYFLHSYYFDCDRDEDRLALSRATAADFACAAQRREHLRRAVPSGEEPPLRRRGSCRTSRRCEVLRPRITPCLLIRNGGLVKTVSLRDDKYVGDPINAVKIFNEKEADELIVVDIDASAKGSAEPQVDRAVRRRMPHAAVLRRRHQDGRTGHARSSALASRRSRSVRRPWRTRR